MALWEERQSTWRTWMNVLRDEFKIKNFSTNYPTEDVFFTAQWEWPPVVFVLYRVLVAAYVLSWLVYSIISVPVWRDLDGVSLPWIAFITNWAFLLLTVYLILAALIAVYKTSNKPCFVSSVTQSTTPETYSDVIFRNPVSVTDSNQWRSSSFIRPEGTQIIVPAEQPAHWYSKLLWVTFNAAATLAPLVTFTYFTLLFPHNFKEEGFPAAVDFHRYGVNTIVVLLDMFICAIPVRLLHVLYPVIYCSAYALFTLIYWALNTHLAIHKHVFDWNNPGITAAVIVTFIFVAIPIFQFLLFGLYRLRIWMYKTVYLHALLSG